MVFCGIYFCRYILGAVETFLDALPQAGIFKRKMLISRIYRRRCKQVGLIRFKKGQLVSYLELFIRQILGWDAQYEKGDLSNAISYIFNSRFVAHLIAGIFVMLFSHLFEQLNDYRNSYGPGSCAISFQCSSGIEDHKYTWPSSVFCDINSCTLLDCIWWCQNHQQGWPRVPHSSAPVSFPYLHWYLGCSPPQRSKWVLSYFHKYFTVFTYLIIHDTELSNCSFWALYMKLQ